jgi:catechol 2,3-dioxygenase-like lactoylglutathione lyase family enzyme
VWCRTDDFPQIAQVFAENRLNVNHGIHGAHEISLESIWAFLVRIDFPVLQSNRLLVRLQKEFLREGEGMNSTLTRREWLQRTALLAAMHAPLLGRPAFGDLDSQGEFRLKRIRLAANNLDEQAAFYGDVLRVPVERPDGKTVRITLGASQVEFSPDAAYEKPFYHFAITIPENQLNAAMDWLSPRREILNIQRTQEKVIHFKNLNAHSCYFLDPAGNILEFIAHHNLKNGTSAPFDPEQLLWVSEIGIVVPSVPEIEKRSAESLGIKPYGGSWPNFSPIGSIYGMLIVVQKDRVWLPTNDVHAGVFPTDVKFTGAKGALSFESLPYSIEQY